MKDSPLNLSVHSIATFNNKEKTDLDQNQQNAVKAMAAWIAPHNGKEMAKLPAHHVKEFILNFSRVFFLADLVPEMIDFQFMEFAADKNGYISKYGHQGHHSGIQEIRVDPRNWAEEKGVQNHKTALIGTLLHECFHAYFCVFCCDVPGHQSIKYSGPARCSRKTEYWDEGHGHFAAWFHLAGAVDIALEKLLGLGTDLCVFRSILLEYSNDDGARVPAEEWKRAFAMFEWQGVDFLLRKLKPVELAHIGVQLSKHPKVVKVFATEYRKKQEEKRKKAEEADAADRAVAGHNREGVQGMEEA